LQKVEICQVASEHEETFEQRSQLTIYECEPRA
jgi:hypothetical protein